MLVCQVSTGAVVQVFYTYMALIFKSIPLLCDAKKIKGLAVLQCIFGREYLAECNACRPLHEKPRRLYARPIPP